MHLANHEKAEEQTASNKQTHLREDEPKAPIKILTPIRRLALLSCLLSGELHREKNRWIAYGDGRIVAGVTVADLVRDGFMVVSLTKDRTGTARLTERGNWFARTIADEEATETEHLQTCVWERL